MLALCCLFSAQCERFVGCFAALFLDCFSSFSVYACVSLCSNGRLSLYCISSGQTCFTKCPLQTDTHTALLCVVFSSAHAVLWFWSSGCFPYYTGTCVSTKTNTDHSRYVRQMHEEEVVGADKSMTCCIIVNESFLKSDFSNESVSQPKQSHLCSRTSWNFYCEAGSTYPGYIWHSGLTNYDNQDHAERRHRSTYWFDTQDWVFQL